MKTVVKNITIDNLLTLIIAFHTIQTMSSTQYFLCLRAHDLSNFIGTFSSS